MPPTTITELGKRAYDRFLKKSKKDLLKETWASFLHDAYHTVQRFYLMGYLAGFLAGRQQARKKKR